MQEQFDKAVVREQIALCEAFGAVPSLVRSDMKLGVSRGVQSGAGPIHGLRILPGPGSSGWYLWTGPWRDDPDFFVPLHAGHLADWCPLALPFLGLPPGWRFLTDGSYRDVWRDEELRLEEAELE